ncbi:hypothetical protein F4212_15230 [Candidatus Poribacteria bacterium]|nr:hypothetical protein [Candidatus Poribacteria bacterium]
MFKTKISGIVLTMLCALFLFGMVLTPCVSAQLAIDDHIATEIVDHDGNTLVTAYVSIDSLDYNSGSGVVDLDGTFYVHNYNQKRSIAYSGELRLEIFDLEGNTYIPDSKEPVSGQLEKNDEDAKWWDVYYSTSKNTNLHAECLSATAFGQKPITAGDEYRASANIALRVTGFHQEETWETSYSTTFEHDPATAVEQLEGIGPTTDGETFSDDCTANNDRERSNWQSLVYTDAPYDAVYWYVKAPGDTSADGSYVGVDWGDGATRKATMTTTFPDDVDDPNKPGDQTRVYYEITAYIYRWDLSVYTKSYLVDVYDK